MATTNQYETLENDDLARWWIWWLHQSLESRLCCHSQFSGKTNWDTKKKKGQKWLWCHGSQWGHHNIARKRTCTIWCPSSSSPCHSIRKHAKCTSSCIAPSKSWMLHYSCHTTSERWCYCVAGDFAVVVVLYYTAVLAISLLQSCCTSVSLVISLAVAIVLLQFHWRFHCVLLVL